MARVSISLAETDKSDVSEVRIDGIVDTNTAGELEETIDSLLNRERYRIIVDLAGVEYISSAGWGAIISKIRDIRSKKGDIILSGMVANVREVYELLEFDNVFKHFRSLDDARGAFGVTLSKQPPKKKETEINQLEIPEIETGGNGSGGSPHSQSAGFSKAGGSIESILIESVTSDPFMSIREIVQHINSLSDTTRVGWWKVFKILKKNNLLSRRARFRLAKDQMDGDQ